MIFSENTYSAGLMMAVSVASLLLLSGCGKDDEGSVESKFYTSDIDLFWDVYDNNEGALTADVFQSQYVNQGSGGLKDFSDQKGLPAALQSTLSALSYRIYYNSIRRNSMNLSSAIKTSKRGLKRLREEFPEAQMKDTYFFIGGMTAGGKVSDNGLLIAVEMFSKDEDTSLNGLSTWHNSVLRDLEYLPSIVLHESIHIQQLIHSGGSGYQTVLEKSIQEGMADFISHYLLAGEPFFNEHIHRYADPKEEEIWNEFKEEMNLNLLSTEWLYTAKRTSQGHPADTGYYVGYKIVESFSNTYPTMSEAIRALLTTDDYVEIFEKSKYEEKFD